MKLIRLVFLFSYISFFTFHCSRMEKADLVIKGGKIYTVDPANPRAASLAVKKGIIISVGSHSLVDPLIGKNTQVIDLKGKTLIPGFIESHGHIMGLGSSKMKLDLMVLKTMMSWLIW